MVSSSKSIRRWKYLQEYQVFPLVHWELVSECSCQKNCIGPFAEWWMSYSISILFPFLNSLWGAFIHCYENMYTVNTTVYKTHRDAARLTPFLRHYNKPCCRTQARNLNSTIKVYNHKRRRVLASFISLCIKCTSSQWNAQLWKVITTTLMC